MNPDEEPISSVRLIVGLIVVGAIAIALTAVLSSLFGAMP
jgi:FlaG/FlaF family flagellin (archaellin)